ncbi:MAG: serine/threonine protein kinase [Frankiales bacterium]|nr:serine/threonine protein kinase [Frankiales bacterium]
MTGATVAGRYALEAVLARGATAEVWRATDLVLQRPVAVKLLLAGSDEESRERFRAEARHAAALLHPGIAAVHDFGESADGVSAWIVMELVDGEPLSAVLAREAPLTVDRTLDVVAQVADALQAAHDQGVVHRDVKPGNLMVRADGTVKVTDFGIARLAAGEHTTGVVVGTAAYLSPEQAGGRPVSPASDLYALGVVAYECLTGSRPFLGAHPSDVARQHLHEHPPELPDSVPSGVRALVQRCLEKDPAHRPVDAADVARQARALRSARPSKTARTDPRPHSRALWLALPLLLVVVGVVVLRAFLAGGGHSVEVPLVRAGSSEVEADSVLRDAGLQVRWRTVADDGVPEGRVVRTEPAAGVRVPDGSTVAVITSGEDVVGMPYAKAAEVLRRRGLSFRPVADAGGGPAGTVRELEPDGPLVPGEEILVHVVPGGEAGR